ncbi:hypothetical protein VTK26DRAFT_2031 [Humicola hyalothermophila]
MADQHTDRPGSAIAGRGYPFPIPPSPRPSIASRESRSSLRMGQERHETPAQAQPASVAYSRPQTPQTATAPLEEQPQHQQHPRHSPPPHPSQPPSFSPLFALLTSTSHSSNRQTIHHPTVHYVFADDDPEILTAALAHHHRGAYENTVEVDDDPSTPRDRAVILDLEPTVDGSSFEVAWASSLSPDWAVTSARVSRMEGNGGGGGGGGVSAGPSANLVLKIEGVSMEPSSGLGKTPTSETEFQSSSANVGRHHPAAPEVEGYGDLLLDFEKRMAILRKVVEAGAARQRALGAGDEQFSEAIAADRT